MLENQPTGDEPKRHKEEIERTKNLSNAEKRRDAAWICVQRENLKTSEQNWRFSFKFHEHEWLRHASIARRQFNEALSFSER